MFQVPPSNPPAAFSDPAVVNMLQRLELSGPAAINVSEELWPHRLKGTCQASDYVEWHDKVHPGGVIHPPDNYEHLTELHIQGRSVEEIAQGLISIMDHFHRYGGNPHTGSGLDIQVPEGVKCSPIISLGVFFKKLRGYIVYVSAV